MVLVHFIGIEKAPTRLLILEGIKRRPMGFPPSLRTPQKAWGCKADVCYGSDYDIGIRPDIGHSAHLPLSALLDPR